MTTYIGLFKYTPQGLANIKAAPDRINAAKDAVEKMGGRVIGTWLTMGEYDLVTIGEWPDDQTAAAFILSLASRGNVRTVSLKAFSEEEFAQIVSKLP